MTKRRGAAICLPCKWNSKRIIDPSTVFGMTKWKDRKPRHLDFKTDVIYLI